MLKLDIEATRRRWIWISVLCVAALTTWLVWPTGPAPERAPRRRDAPPSVSAEEGRDRAQPQTGPIAKPDEQRSSFLVLDLVDDRPAPSLRLRLGPGTPVREVSTGSAGFARFTGGPPGTVRAADDVWRVVGNRTFEFGGRATCRAYRVIELAGTLRLPAGVDELPEEATVQYRVIGMEPTMGGVARSVWLLSQGVPLTGEAPVGGTELSFSTVIPRIRKVLVTARACGLYSDPVKVPLTRATESARVEIRLKRGTLVQGVLTDHTGEPIKGVPVTVFVTFHTTMDKLDWEQAIASARGKGAGMMHSANPVTGRVEITYVYSGASDKFGGYSIPIHSEGRAIVSAHIPDRKTIRVDLGPLDRHRDLDLQAELPVVVHPVQILIEGRRAAGRTIDITDVTRGQPQITASLRADKQGRIPDYRLEKGRYYIISAGGKDQEFVEWRGQGRVDITPTNKKDRLLPDGWWE